MQLRKCYSRVMRRCSLSTASRDFSREAIILRARFKRKCEKEAFNVSLGSDGPSNQH